MSQSRGGSALEALSQVVGGLLLSAVSYLWVIPMIFGLSFSGQVTLQLTLYFAVAAWIKSFGIRRLWNAYVRHEVRRVPTQVGSIQSLPRAGRLSSMSGGRDEDTSGGNQFYQSKGPDGQDKQVNESTLSKEDKELR